MRLPLTLLALLLISINPLRAQQPAPLRIVVVEGEGAVNIIQQKTAVRPLVEVRDRNNLPVSGASVTFTIPGGQSAFAGGAQSMTVTTNATGQAAASGLNAVSSGAVQIQVQAAYQGLAATAMISQTNFLTAAAAAAAGAGGGGAAATGAAGGAAGGGGGGLSATTIAIIGGAAAAGGVVAVTQAGGGDDSGSDGEEFDTYNGSFSGSFTTTTVVQSTCVFTNAGSGTVSIELFQGNATGRAAMQLQYTPTSLTGNCVLGPTTSLTLQWENTTVSGGPSALTFNGTVQIGSQTHAVVFNGSHSGTTINGTIRLTITTAAGVSPTVSGSATFPVTLTGGPRS
jgi:hypothetical protein